MGKKKPPAKPKGNGRHAADKKPQGCYVLSLSVENVRCFGPKQTLDCSDGSGKPRQWTVILGDNGTGKTTLLHLITFCNLWTSESFGGPRFVRSEKPISRVVISQGIAGLRDAPRGTHDVILTNRKPGTQFGSETWSSEDDPRVRLPLVLLGYDTTRRQFAESTVADRTGRHPVFYAELESRARSLSEWLIRLDYAAAKNASSSQIARRDEVVRLLVAVLDDVREIRFKAGGGPYPEPSVEFLTSFGWVPLRQLGHGYQTMIAWVVDFVSRMVERYPNSENPLAEPAVCLVDEIDLHLHPVWQRKVIGYLSERFPNTQFIVTAHSPLVVQAAASADANIAVLVRSEEKDADGNHYVEIRNNPEDVRNWRLDQILTSDLFGNLDLRSAETEKLFARKRELLAKPKRTKQEDADLARVNAEIEALPVGDSEKFARELDLLKRAAEELKSSRKP